MKILFLGLLFNPDKENEQLNLSKCGLQNSVNTFQINLINGFIKNLQNEELTVFNTLPVGVFPNKYKKIILKSKKWIYDDLNNYEIGCINLPILKQITRRALFTKKIREWINASDKNKNIIAYSLYPVFIHSLKQIKKEYPQVKITIIVPDVPSSFGILPNNIIKSLIYRISGDRALNNLQYFDSFVLLTEAMKEPLKIGSRPFTVVEGLVVNEETTVNKEQYDTQCLNEENKIIVYTGSLNYEFGIKNLLDAFDIIKNHDYRLWICGSGDAERYIIDKAEKDIRIKFFGYVTKMKINELQQSATILINPRQNKGTYTKYSFPSKTMEYLASGKPVIMHKLDGIPSEYDKYLFYVRDNFIESLRDRIIEVCSLPTDELKQIGERARDWVLKEKNASKQAQKIIYMLHKFNKIKTWTKGRKL